MTKTKRNNFNNKRRRLESDDETNQTMTLEENILPIQQEEKEDRNILLIQQEEMVNTTPSHQMVPHQDDGNILRVTQGDKRFSFVELHQDKFIQTLR